MKDTVVRENKPSFITHALKILRTVVPWLVSAGLLSFVILTNDMDEVVRAFYHVNWIVYIAVTIPFLLCLLLLETTFLTYGFRWFAGAGCFSDLLRARAATYLLTVISIFVGLGGLMVYGKRRYGVSYAMGTTIMLNELLHELASQCTLAMLVSILLTAAYVPEAAKPAIAGVATVGLIGVSIYVFILIINRLARFMPAFIRENKVLAPFSGIPIRQYGSFYLIKLVQNLLYGLFLAGLLLAFNICPPIITSIGFMQIIHLTRALPISAFGIGVDQVAITELFRAWEPPGSGLLLAASVVFTFTLIIGRALLGVPFIKSVSDDLVERPAASGA